MQRNKYMVALVGLIFVLVALLVEACGPFFPMQLLDNRESSLRQIPSNSFEYEASHLITLDQGYLVAYRQLRLKHAGQDETSAQTQTGHLAKDETQADQTPPTVAEIGDEALNYLIAENPEQLCDYASFINNTSCAARIPAGKLKTAVALYAIQAATNSNSGVQSLRAIAQWAVKDKRRVAKLIDDSLGQRLLVAYALARLDDEGDDQHAKANPLLVALIEAIQDQGVTHVVGADRLAALAYRAGRYDFAAILVAQSESVLASWVKAKLALQRGDIEAATQAYANAVKGFPALDASIEPSNSALITGEIGVLTLSRGQYIDALGHFYRAAVMAESQSLRATDDALNSSQDGRENTLNASLDKPWIGYDADMAYVAERVLTSDELKQFVDASVPSSPAPPMPKPEVEYFSGKSVSSTLRYLLARRLLREGRVVEALPYFPEDNDPRYGQTVWDEGADGGKGEYLFVTVPTRQLARAYGDALEDAKHAWTSAARAKAWFTAATLAKRWGMELIGYEQAPDYRDVDGNFEWGTGRAYQNQPWSLKEKEVQPPLTALERAALDLPGNHVTQEEKRRYALSESQPLKRFHYRELAADFATHAADELPSRSQAFSAVLCHATGWMNVYDFTRAQQFYQRYVKEGALLNTEGGFGTQCPDPDFDAAARFPIWYVWFQTRHYVSQHKPATMVTLVGLLALIGVFFWRQNGRSANAKAQKSTDYDTSD